MVTLVVLCYEVPQFCLVVSSGVSSGKIRLAGAMTLGLWAGCLFDDGHDQRRAAAGTDKPPDGQS